MGRKKYTLTHKKTVLDLEATSPHLNDLQYKIPILV